MLKSRNMCSWIYVQGRIVFFFLRVWMNSLDTFTPLCNKATDNVSYMTARDIYGRKEPWSKKATRRGERDTFYLSTIFLSVSLWHRERILELKLSLWFVYSLFSPYFPSGPTAIWASHDQWDKNQVDVHSYTGTSNQWNWWLKMSSVWRLDHFMRRQSCLGILDNSMKREAIVLIETLWTISP